MLFIHDVDATSSRCALPNPPAAFRQQRPVLMRATGSLLFVLSVGVFFSSINGSAIGRIDRPSLASQLVHSFETIRTTAECA
jgi:hypothetical protein